MSDICPKGHLSTDPEFCSECGASMKAGASLVNAAPAPDTAPAAGGETCPDCMTPRRPGARYCEMCRYDFAARTSFDGLGPSATQPKPQAAADVAATKTQPVPDSLGASMPAAAAAPSTSAARAEAPVLSAAPVSNASPPDARSAADLPATTTPRLKLRIVVDASLYTELAPDVPCPVDTPAKVFHLDLDENTLGRQYEGKGIHPEIVIHDPGISRRHLKFVRSPEGAFSVLELGSSNGTLFNRNTLEPGVETLVKPGDELTLGMWTRVYVEGR
jgi:hypothetical protein